MTIRRTFLGVLAWLVGAAVLAADAPVPAELPMEGEGQLRFFVDLSGFRGRDGRTDQEVYVSISNDQLAFRGEPEGPQMGHLLLRLVFRDREGEIAFSRETTFRPQATSDLDARDRAIVQVMRENASLTPGLYLLEVHLTDELSLRTGILNRLRRAHREGKVEGWVRVGDFSGEGLTLSDLTLIRGSRQSEGDAVFGRHGVDFDPNPSRLYGLVLPVAMFYLEVYSGPTFEPGDSYLVRTRVLDAAGVPVVEKTSRARPHSSSFVVTDAVALTEGVPPGGYSLDITVLNEKDRRSAGAREPFDVIWAAVSWGRDPDEILEEMALIMTGEEYDTLEGLSPGAQEIFLAKYWHALDPTPNTPENEVLQAFRERVRRADREFRSTLNRGILTDRGRVYVRYGPPDDIDYEFSSSGFGLDRATERVAEPGERATLSGRPATSFLNPDEFREGDVSGVARQRGGATVRSKQLEIWIYDGPGHPLTGRTELGTNSHRGLKFIFADEMGNGNYTLIGSTGAELY